MSRWEPDARGRLEKAALALYGERGFENTTVAEIADRAGLTERTFFRYFTDKREVLFAGAGSLQDLLVNAVVDAPQSQVPIDAIATALGAAADLFEERRDFSRQRQSVIVANSELQERRTDQDGHARLCAGRRAAPARSHRPGRGPGCRGRDSGVQNRLRTLGQRDQPTPAVRTNRRFLRPAESRDHRSLITA